jgi:hypothetical protein
LARDVLDDMFPRREKERRKSRLIEVCQNNNNTCFPTLTM